MSIKADHRAAAPRSVRLFVRRETLEVVSLPTLGRYEFGRADTAQIVVRDNTVSRTHASLDFGEFGMTLTDLGSANGSRIAGRPIAPLEALPIGVGEPFMLGDVTAFVFDGPANLRASWSHDRADLTAHVERLVAEQAGLSGSGDTAFAVATLRGDGLAAKRELLTGLAFPAATLAVTANNLVTVLLPRVARTLAVAWCEAVAPCLVNANGTGVAAEVRAYPEDGQLVDELLAHEIPQSTAPAKLVDVGALARARPASPGEAAAARARPNPSDSLDDELSRIERAKIIDVLDKCGGNQTRAAEMLGISRRALIGRLEKYNLPRPRR